MRLFLLEMTGKQHAQVKPRQYDCLNKTRIIVVSIDMLQWKDIS